MKTWGRVVARSVVITIPFVACTNPAAPADAGDGISDRNGLSGSGGTGGGGGFGQCASSPPADAGLARAPYGELGSTGGEFGVTRHGYVSSVATDRAEVTTPDGIYSFGWHGPSLDTAFAVDDVVQLLVTPYTGYGYGFHNLSVLRSSSATATVMDGQPWLVLSTEPGATTTLRSLPPDYPELVYGLVSCCTRRSAFGASATRCDYSALEARLDGVATAIPLGATGTIGAWSVTNLQSTYSVDVESSWDILVTLLGPATPRSVDGGL